MGGVSVEDDGAVGWVLVFKNQRNPYRAFNERKREPQDPGLHACIYLFVCISTGKHEHILMRALVNIYVYLIDTGGPYANACELVLTWRFVVVR